MKLSSPSDMKKQNTKVNPETYNIWNSLEALTKKKAEIRKRVDSYKNEFLKQAALKADAEFVEYLRNLELSPKQQQESLPLEVTPLFKFQRPPCIPLKCTNKKYVCLLTDERNSFGRYSPSKEDVSNKLPESLLDPLASPRLPTSSSPTKRSKHQRTNDAPQYLSLAELPPINTASLGLDEVTARKYFGPDAKLNYLNVSKTILHHERNLGGGLEELIERFVTPARQKLIDTAHKNDIHDKKSDLSSFSTTTAVAAESQSDPVRGNSLSPMESSFAQFPGDLANIDSPRSVFITACMAKHIIPPLLPVRQHITTVLDLSHHALGDDVLNCLVLALKSMPLLETLNLSDNKLTSVSLKGLMTALFSVPTICHLDISWNDPGPESIIALGAYLNYVHSSLQSICLHNCGLRDEDCAVLFTALMRNSSLRLLNVASNHIGDIIESSKTKATASEALVQYLQTTDNPIQHLDVSWNSVHTDAILELCDSLHEVCSLLHLDLSHVRLGREAGMVLGSALSDSRSLRRLVLENCGLDCMACFTIACGVRDCLTFQSLVMDGNTIGELGARMLLSLAYTCHHREVEVSLNRCDCTGKLAYGIDLTRLHGEYDLELSTAYGRAVFLEILNQVTLDGRIKLENVLISDEDKSNSSTLMLTRDRYTRDHRLLDKQQDHLHALKEAFNSLQDVHKLEDILTLSDLSQKSHRKTLNLDELIVALGGINIQTTHEQIRSMSGGLTTLTWNDCRQLWVTLKEDTLARISDLESDAYVRSHLHPRDRYRPPVAGHARLKVLSAFTIAGEKLALTSQQYRCLSRIANTSQDVARSILFGLQGKSVRLEEALHTYKVISAGMGHGDEVVSVAMLLPFMGSISDARLLVKLKLGYDVNKIIRLKTMLGYMYNTLLGHYNGYYFLDMTNGNDRECLCMLIRRSEEFSGRRKDAKLCDPSQMQDWTCFRNVLRREGGQIKGGSNMREMIELGHLARTGTYEFDFACVDTYSIDEDKPICSSEHILDLLKQTGLIHGVLIERMQQLLSRDPELSPVNAPVFSSETCSYLRKQFYDRLPFRKSVVAGDGVLPAPVVSPGSSHKPSISRKNQVILNVLVLAREKVMLALNDKLLLSRNVEAIIEFLGQPDPDCHAPESSNFGTHRVEIIIFLLSHIVDAQNLYRIMAKLAPDEVSAVIARVGYLNGLINPFISTSIPSQLDSHYPDERIVIMMSVVLLASASSSTSSSSIIIISADDSTSEADQSVTPTFFNHNDIPVAKIISVLSCNVSPNPETSASLMGLVNSRIRSRSHDSATLSKDKAKLYACSLVEARGLLKAFNCNWK